MSNAISAYIDENSILTVDESNGFSGEHNAEVLEITLGTFAQEGYDYYILNFSNARIAGKQVSNEIRSESDLPAYTDGEKIYCPLSNALTCTGRLKIQLEAHKTDEGGEVIKKTSVAQLKFKPSIMGLEDMLTSDSPALIRLIQLESRLSALEALHSEELSTLDAQLNQKLDELGAAHAEDLEELNAQITAKLSELKNTHGNDIETINSELEKLSVIPFATQENVGGFMLSDNSPVTLDGNGAPELIYSNLNMYALTVMCMAALLEEEGGGNSFFFENTEQANTYLEAMCSDLMMGLFGYTVVSVINGGEIAYINENYETCIMNIPSNSVTVFKYTDGVIQVENFAGSKLRNLLTEGV